MKNRHALLLLVFLITFALRLYFSLNAQYYSDSFSYFAQRQIEHIAVSGKPIYEDNLSYGGRVFVFTPVFYYFLAFFIKIFPGPIIKIVNSFLASTIVISVYILSSRIIKNKYMSLLCALVSSSIPVYINETLNNISMYSILVPGTFFLYNQFLSLEDEKNILLLVILTVSLTLASPASFIILLGLIIFLVLSYLENIKINRIKIEYVLFFLFFFLWMNFIIFKVAFQEHGLRIIWGNAPSIVIEQNTTTILNALTNIGFIPFILALYITYKYLLKKKSKNVLIFVSLFITSFVLFWTRVIAAEISIIFLGISSVVLFGVFLKNFAITIKKSKFAKYQLFNALIALIVLTQIIPSFVIMWNNIKNSPNSDYVHALTWIKQNTPVNSTILAHPKEGHFITYFAQRKNVMDEQYLLIEDVNARYEDIKSIYTQKFEVEAVRRLQNYNVDYILLSEYTKDSYKISEISYIDDQCFDIVYNQSVKLYRFKKEICKVKTL